MSYKEILPVEALRDYVRYFWVLEDLEPALGVKNFKILPDGIPALIFQDIPNVFVDQENRTPPQLYVYGQFTKYTDQRVEGSFRIIGAYLEPSALKTIFKIDAIEVTNQNIALEDIMADSILERLLNAGSIDDKIRIISDFLLQQIAVLKYENQSAKFVSTLLQRGKTLRDVQQEMNISERTLERLVKQNIGMSPKMFSRIIRFQSNLNLLRNTEYKHLTELTYTSGYFDQSHYIREFKEFTGSSPKSFVLKTNEALANFPEWKE